MSEVKWCFKPLHFGMVCYVAIENWKKGQDTYTCNASKHLVGPYRGLYVNAGSLQ